MQKECSMRRSVFTLIATIGILFAGWYQVRVPLSGNNVPSALNAFDVTHLEPGVEAELVVHEAELPLLERSGIPYEIVIDDLEAYYASQMSGDGPFGDYYTLAEAIGILDSLHEQYPDIISGRKVLPNDDYDDLTWDGNHVYAVKISDNVEAEEDEPEVLYTGLHHAREPICVNICVEWARWLCENYGQDPLATYLVDNRQIWIIPIVNPDGYLYNEQTFPQGGGMHRKNRNPAGYPNQGVDINRNYTYMWGYDDQGSSPTPQSPTYRGTAPGSEPETQSVMNLCKAHDFVTAINFHSHADLFMYPWSYKSGGCEDSTVIYDWGEVCTRTNFYAVTPDGLAYKINGGACDWMYGETEEKNRIFPATVEVGDEFWQEYAIEEHIAENFPLLVATAKAAGPYLELQRVWWADENGDGNISPGETVNLGVDIHNMNVRDATGKIELELSGTDSRVELTVSSATIPSLDPQQGSSNQSDIQVKLSSAAPLDSAIAFDLTVTDTGYEFVHTIILPVGNREVLLDEDFDDQNCAGWTSQGDWGFTTEHAHSGRYSITDSPYSHYSDGTQFAFESPKLNLADKVTAEVSFWLRFSTQRGLDWAAFQVRGNRTDEWTTLKHWSGFQDEWLKGSFNLTEFCSTDEFQMRFLLQSDGEYYLDGWYIDDVELTTFKGKVTTGAVHELTDIRPQIDLAGTVTDGVLDFIGPQGTRLLVAVFDASGRRVARTEGVTPFSWQMCDINAYPLAPGPYFIRINSSDKEVHRKVVLVD